MSNTPLRLRAGCEALSHEQLERLDYLRACVKEVGARHASGPRQIWARWHDCPETRASEFTAPSAPGCLLPRATAACAALGLFRRASSSVVLAVPDMLGCLLFLICCSVSLRQVLRLYPAIPIFPREALADDMLPSGDRVQAGAHCAPLLCHMRTRMWCRAEQHLATAPMRELRDVVLASRTQGLCIGNAKFVYSSWPVFCKRSGPAPGEGSTSLTPSGHPTACVLPRGCGVHVVVCPGTLTRHLGGRRRVPAGALGSQTTQSSSVRCPHAARTASGSCSNVRLKCVPAAQNTHPPRCCRSASAGRRRRSSTASSSCPLAPAPACASAPALPRCPLASPQASSAPSQTASQPRVWLKRRCRGCLLMYAA